MPFKKSENWKWKDWDISWSYSKQSSNNSDLNILLIHGFGASKRHWRHNQDFLGNIHNCYSIDLLGFGESSQPGASAVLNKVSTPGIFAFSCILLIGLKSFVGFISL